MYRRLLLLWIVAGVALSLYAWLARGSLVVTAASVAFLLAGVATLLIRQHRLSYGFVPGKPTTFAVSLAVFTVLFSVSLIVYAARTEPYVRPLTYFVLTSLAAGALILAAATSDTSRRSQTVAVILGAISLGLSLEWTVTLMYPVTVGLDPWYHQWYTQKIINDGGIQAIGQRLPLFPLIAAGTMWLTKLPYNLAVMVSVSLIQVVADVFLIYKIGSLVLSKRVGMIAAVLLVTASWHVWFGYWTIPNTLAVPETLVAVYLLMRWDRDRWRRAIPLLVAVCAATLFTHVLAMVWVALAVGTWLAIKVVESHREGRLRLPAKAAGLFALFVAVAAVWLLWQGDYLGTLRAVEADPSVIGDYAYDYHPHPQEVEVGTVTFPGTKLYRETWVAGNAEETLFNVSGMILFFGAALVGALLVLRKWHGTTWWVCGIGMIALAAGSMPMLFGVSVFQQRWWYLSQAFLVLPIASVSCSWLWSRRIVVMVGVTALLTLMVFLSAVGRPDNMDNQTLSQNQLVRYALTGPEVETLVRIHKEYPDAVIGLDGYYLTTARQILEYGQSRKDWGDEKLFNISPNILSGDFSNVEADIVLLRQTLIDDPIADGGGVIYHLEYDPKVVIVKQGFDLIEDNGSVAIFIRTTP